MTKRALIVIDIQNDYFEGGKWPLHQMDKTVIKAREVLEDARKHADLIIHVYHEFHGDNPPFFAPATKGAEIHESVTPLEGEIVVLKNHVNAFRETALKEILEQNDIADVTLIGAMSHMCIDAAARSATDYGFNVTVIEDACASRDLEFQGKTIPAEDVHAAYMSALTFAYGSVVTSADYFGSFR